MLSVMRWSGNRQMGEFSPVGQAQANPAHGEAFRSKLLVVERAMADFLRPQPAARTQDRPGLQPPVRTPAPDDYARL